MRSRRAAPALALLIALAVGGCAGLGDPDEGTGDSTGASEPTESATMPTEVPSWLLECGQDDPERDEELQLAALDLTTATWSTPADFTVVTSYHEDNPVETIYSTWYAEPINPTRPSLNVIQIVIYTGLDWGDLADGCGRVPLSAIEEQLARYREQIGAQPLGDAQLTELAGHPAVAQDLSLASYDYTGWWLFSETQLLHLYCQWTASEYRDVIEQGCTELADSLRVD